MTELAFDASDVGGSDTEVRFARPPIARGRVVAAAVVLVGALVVISVALGSSGGGNAASTSTTTTTTTTTTSETTTATTSDPAVAEATATSTAPDVTTITTTTSPVVRIGTDPLLGEPTGLALLIGGVHVAIVDLDRATLTFVPSSGRVIGAQLTPVGLAYRSGSGSLYLLAPGAAAPQPIASGGVYLGEGPPGRAWFQIYGAADSGRYVHVDAPGATPIAADLPDGVASVYPDGDGGWFTVAGGGIYRLGLDGGSVRLATGDLIGASDGHALARSCDDQLRCRYVVVDLATGVIRTGPAAPSGFSNGGARLSPDGSWILEVVGGQPSGGDGRFVARDLDGTSIDLGAAESACLAQFCPVSPQWSRDGAWLFWIVDSATIAAWRPGLQTPRFVTMPDGQLAERLSSLTALAVGTPEQLAVFATPSGLSVGRG